MAVRSCATAAGTTGPIVPAGHDEQPRRCLPDIVAGRHGLVANRRCPAVAVLISLIRRTVTGQTAGRSPAGAAALGMSGGPFLGKHPGHLHHSGDHEGPPATAPDRIDTRTARVGIPGLPYIRQSSENGSLRILCVRARPLRANVGIHRPGGAGPTPDAHPQLRHSLTAQVRPHGTSSRSSMGRFGEPAERVPGGSARQSSLPLQLGANDRRVASNTWSRSRTDHHRRRRRCQLVTIRPSGR